MPFGSDIDLNKLRVFTSVAHHGSFTAAGRALGLPTSSVSRALAALEEELGARLLHRTARSLSLTGAGRTYLDQISGPLQHLERAGRQLKTGHDLAGTIKLTAPPPVLASLVMPVIARYRELHPAVSFDTRASSQPLDLVQEGIDLAIRMGRVTGPHLVVRKLGTSTPRLYASTTYLNRRGEPRSPKDLAEHDGVLFRGHLKGSRLRLVGPRGKPREVELRAAVWCDDYLMARYAVLQGCGIGVVPRFFAAPDVAAGRIVPILPNYGLEGVAAWLVSPGARGDQPEHVTRFKEMLFEAFSE
jgi:DNA-binding transcriptional LysR family regulator